MGGGGSGIGVAAGSLTAHRKLSSGSRSDKAECLVFDWHYSHHQVAVQCGEKNCVVQLCHIFKICLYALRNVYRFILVAITVPKKGALILLGRAH